MPLLSPLYAIKPLGSPPPPPMTVNAVMFIMNGANWSTSIDGYTFIPGDPIIDPDSMNVLTFKGIKYYTPTDTWYAFMFDTVIIGYDEFDTPIYDYVYSIWSGPNLSLLTWTKVTQLPPLTDFLFNDGSFYTNGDYWLFPLGGSTPTISLYKTSDFINFTPVTISGFYNESIQSIKTISWDPVGNQWVFSGNSASDGASGNTLIATSPDGENWDIGPAIDTQHPHNYQLALTISSFGNKLLTSIIGISGGPNTPYIYSSPIDNSAWTLRRSAQNISGVLSNAPVAFCTNGDICIGVNDPIIASYNGIDWTQIERGFQVSDGDYCQPLNMFILMGSNDAFIRSFDGLTWEQGLSDGSGASYTNLACRQSIPLVGDDTGSPITCYYPIFAAEHGFPADPDLINLPLSIPDITVNANPHGYFRTFGQPDATFEFDWVGNGGCTNPGAYEITLKYNGEVPCGSGSGWSIQIFTPTEGFNGGGFVPLHGVSIPHYVDSTGWTNFPSVINGNLNLPAYIAPDPGDIINCVSVQSTKINNVSSACPLPFGEVIPAYPGDEFGSGTGYYRWHFLWEEVDEFDVPTGITINILLIYVYNYNGYIACNFGTQFLPGWHISAYWNSQGVEWDGHTSDLNAITCIDGVLSGTISATGNGMFMSCDENIYSVIQFAFGA